MFVNSGLFWGWSFWYFGKNIGQWVLQFSADQGIGTIFFQTQGGGGGVSAEVWKISHFLLIFVRTVTIVIRYFFIILLID